MFQTGPLSGLLTVILISLSTSAYSQQSNDNNPDPTYFYVGAKAGWMHYQNACEEWSVSCDGDDSGFGLFAGYQFSEHFALEAAYMDLGEAVATYRESGIDNSYVGSMRAGELSLLGRLPLNDKLDLFAKVGTFHWDGENQGPVTRRSDSDWSPMAGVGAEYQLSSSWVARLEYQYIDKLGSELIGGSNGHLTTLGLSYRFGQTKTQPAATKDKVVLPPVLEEPVEIEKAIPVVLPEIAIKVLFDFDSSALLEPEALQPVIARLKSVPEAIATIKGYTDSTGASSYNQLLSKRRVQSVVDHLVSYDIAIQQLDIHAYGESFPEQDNDSEAHRHSNRRVTVTIESSTVNAQ